MSLVLGLDSGGTKTIMALADRQGHVTGMRRGAGLSPVQEPCWAEHLAELLARAPDVRTGCAAAVLGLPLHGEVAQFSAQQIKVAQELLGPAARVENDVQIAFTGAFAGQTGALILAGTGSMAWASAGGPHIRVGGWGELIGDEGSAYWIGAQAINVVSQCLDGRRDDGPFVAALLTAIGVTGPHLMEWVYSRSDVRKAIAGLATTVALLAEGGNSSAAAILDAAADQLALHLHTAWRLIEAKGPMVWSYAGGVFNSGLMLKKLQERAGCAPRLPRLPPVGGALLQAALNAGWQVDDAWVSTLASSLATQNDNLNLLEDDQNEIQA